MLQINPFDIPEILNRILTCTSILSANDLALTALVSKSWALASRRALWQDLELNSESWIDVHYNNLYKQLMRYGHFVRVLTLTDCGPDKARFCELMCMMKNLQVVLLDRLMLRGHASILQESLDLLFFPQLCVLKLPYMISSSSGPDILLRICNSAHKIQRLELMDSDFDGKALALIEEACQSLVSLDLSRNEVVTLNESITKHVAMDQVEEHWLGSKIPNTSPIVDTSFGLSTRTPTCGSTQNSNMLPLTQKMTDASSPLALQSRQHTHVHEFTSRKPSERHEFQDSRTQYGNIQRCCRPSLLEMRQPFMYLEELSLVFCLGITNSDFQTLFQSFHGKNLRSLDLQFTNIEDSGLETLADALTMRCTHPTLQSIKYTGITCVNVSFCSKITARGINALVKGCPQLLELEFLSCDSVSAECFQNTMPWACAGLKRLEFTVHPRVLFLDQSIKNKDTVNRRLSTTVSEEEGGSAAAVAKNHDPTPYRTINQGDQQSQMTAQHQKGNLLQRAHHGILKIHKQCTQRKEDIQPNDKESILSDYYAMFRQIKLLTELQSLQIFNSPALNTTNNAGSLPEEYSVPEGPHIQQNWDPTLEGAMSTEEDLQETNGGGRNIIDGELRDAQNMQDSNSDSGPSLGHPFFHKNKIAMAPLLIAGSVSNSSICPFSFRMGLKALGRLKKLQTLTFYERSNVVFGPSEMRWIGKTFPQLSVLQLRGAIEAPDKSFERLKKVQPGIQLQVCPLFDNPS